LEKLSLMSAQHEQKNTSAEKKPRTNESYKLNIEKRGEKKEGDLLDEVWILEEGYDEYCI